MYKYTYIKTSGNIPCNFRNKKLCAKEAIFDKKNLDENKQETKKQRKKSWKRSELAKKKILQKQGPCWSILKA